MTRLLPLVFALAAACGKPGVVPRKAALGDTADQVMGKMLTNITDNGVQVLQLTADTARIYQNRQVADLQSVTVMFFDKSGKWASTVTSKTGVYSIRDKSLDMRGNVVATTPGQKTLKTEHLIYDRIANQVRSDTAFTFTAPDGNGSGASFESDPDFRNIVTLKPRGQQKGKGFLLPGQRDAAGKPK